MSKEVNWSNKTVFILAAIGSAAGLGNLWKFPYLVYDNGGLSFIIAYLVMLFFVGIGLLVGEVAFGQQSRQGAVGAFGDVSKYLRWVGWATIGFAFTILTYYVVVVGWGLDYLYYSIQGLFTGNLSWAGDPSGFFYNNVLGLTDGVGTIGNLSYVVMIGTIVSLILLYFFTFKSAKSVGKVVMITATVPFLTLIILTIRALTLENASLGISFLTTLDVSKLTEFSTWSTAGGQIFFTLSLSMGTMLAYGALKKDKSEIVKATVLVALGNTIVSFLSAITVFGTLGYLAGVKGVPVTDVVAGGPGLVFTTIPETLTHFSNFSAIIAVVFFLTVFLLAIDSAMSLIEAVVMPLKNKFKHISNELLTFIVIVLIGLVSTIYLKGNGLYMLDIVDHYITELAMLGTGFIELLVLLFVSKKLTKYIESRNECNFKFILNSIYFKLSWIFGILVIGTLIVININSGYFVYDSYTESDLINNGLIPIISVFVIAIIINIIELIRMKKN